MAWPELLGQNVDKAVSIIQKENPTLRPVVLNISQDAPDPVDYVGFWYLLRNHDIRWMTLVLEFVKQIILMISRVKQGLEVIIELKGNPEAGTEVVLHPPAAPVSRIFSCKFYSSLALRGHQNAHKRERTLAKGLCR